MSSKQQPLTLHIAIFPSLRTIYDVGGQNEQVSHIQGTYSKSITHRKEEATSRFLRSKTATASEFIEVRWTASPQDPAVPIKEIIEDLEKDNMPDVIIQKLTILVPWITHHPLHGDVKTIEEWHFRPYTFRPGMWERLKADVFPSQPLYRRFKEVKERASDGVKRHWRDALLFNQPKEHLDNQEIRNIWTNKDYALILKEARGNFGLMDLGELK